MSKITFAQTLLGMGAILSVLAGNPVSAFCLILIIPCLEAERK